MSDPGDPERCRNELDDRCVQPRCHRLRDGGGLILVRAPTDRPAAWRATTVAHAPKSLRSGPRGERWCERVKLGEPLLTGTWQTSTMLVPLRSVQTPPTDAGGVLGRRLSYSAPARHATHLLRPVGGVDWLDFAIPGPPSGVANRGENPGSRQRLVIRARWRGAPLVAVGLTGWCVPWPGKFEIYKAMRGE